MQVFNVDFMDSEVCFMVAAADADEAASMLISHQEFSDEVEKSECDPPIQATREDVMAVLLRDERVSGGDRYGIVDESIAECLNRHEEVVPYWKVPTAEQLAEGQVWMLQHVKPEENGEGGWTHCAEYVALSFACAS